MEQVQAVWGKLTANERLESIGAVVIIVSWILAILQYGIGSNSIALIGALAVLAILYLKYAPNQSITWPAPVPVILLAVTGVVAVIELLDLLRLVSYLGAFASYFGISFLAIIGTIVGAAIMVWGAYQEWSGSKSTA